MPTRAHAYTRPTMTGRVFRRSTVPDPPVAVRAHGSTIETADGRTLLDAAGGAIVVNVGHGRTSVAEVMAEQAARLAYAHGSAFTTRGARGLCGGGRAPPAARRARPSTPSAAARRRSRPRSRWPAPTTSPAARRSAGSSSPAGAAITATRSAPSTCPAGGRCADRTRPGWAASGMSAPPTPTAPASRARMPSAPPTRRPRSWSRCSSWPRRAPWPPSSASPSWAPRSPPPSRPTATGRPSPRSVGATACCSSPTRS